MPVIATILLYGLRTFVPARYMPMFNISGLGLAAVVGLLQVLRGVDMRQGQHYLLVIRKAGWGGEALYVLLPALLALVEYFRGGDSSLSPDLTLAFYLTSHFFWKRNIFFTEKGVLIDWRLTPWGLIKKVTLVGRPGDDFDEILLTTDSMFELEVRVPHTVTDEAFNVLKKKIPHIEFEHVTPSGPPL